MLRKFPPAGKPIRTRKPLQSFHSPKNDLLDKFRRRYPNADPPRVELRLATGYKSAGYNFVTQQLELMQKEGLSEAEAFEVVEKRYVHEVDTRVLEEASARS